MAEMPIQRLRRAAYANVSSSFTVRQYAGLAGKAASSFKNSIKVSRLSNDMPIR